jgi:hypothetical protein
MQAIRIIVNDDAERPQIDFEMNGLLIQKRSGKKQQILPENADIKKNPIPFITTIVVGKKKAKTPLANMLPNQPKAIREIIPGLSS